jgi:hypothetical protein
VANSLDTSSFLNAYRRFVCRRGPVRQLRSDCGSNFVGGENEINAAVKEMEKEKIKDELLKDNCDFLEMKMNVPHASHMGGIWERQIRTARNVLRVLLSNHGKQLDDESLHTFMIEAEAIVNSRPLTTENAFDLAPLSPNNLLTMKSNVVLPPPGVFQRYLLEKALASRSILSQRVLESMAERIPSIVAKAAKVDSPEEELDNWRYSSCRRRKPS